MRREGISMKNIYDLCKQHMNQHVLLQTTTGEQIEGMIINLDDQNVYVAVPNQRYEYDRLADSYDSELEYESRQPPYYQSPSNPYQPGPHPPYPPYQPGGPTYPQGPSPYPPYGPGPYQPGYPAPYPPQSSGSNLEYLIIPLTALAALSVIPMLR